MDPISAIYTIVRERLSNSNSSSLSYTDVLPSVLNKVPQISPLPPFVFSNTDIQGYRQQQLDECLDEYESLNVWSLTENRRRITIV